MHSTIQRVSLSFLKNLTSPVISLRRTEQGPERDFPRVIQEVTEGQDSKPGVHRSFKMPRWGESPLGPKVRTLHIHCRGHWFSPRQGTKIPQTARCDQKIKVNKQKMPT